MTFEVLAIVIGLIALMALAYRGFPVIVFAPICAMVAVAISSRPILPSYTEVFMTSTANFVKSFFPQFLLGAIFGKLMETSGAAASIANAIATKLGPQRSILAVVLACGVLTYGGVSLFVVAFAVYPFASALFRESMIPKRLIPGTIALGAFTFTMDALPGSPQIQNLIPTSYFGTDIYAAPIAGITGGLMVAIGGLFWLEKRRRSAQLAGELYSDEITEATSVNAHKALPNVYFAMLPLLLVLVCNLLLSRSNLGVTRWYSESFLAKEFPTLNLKTMGPTWVLIVSLIMGILAAMGLQSKKSFRTLHSTISTATTGALLAIFNTASEVGFGNVVKSLPGFKVIQESVFLVSRYVLISEAVAVNLLAGITGSASGGLSIALEVMSAKYLEIARMQDISPEMLHRVASMASGGMDTLPHNGAVITLLAITGMTHRQAYRDIFAITVLKTLTVFLMAGVASFL